MLESNPLWYKDAIIYQVHVRAFYDSDGDGIGDFRGLTQKLDYLQDLGVTAVWLLPFYPSPLKDDGYDIADYTDVNRMYGTLRDVKLFVREAHRRGLRVVTELVCNHTSDQHPWFQRAHRAKPGSIWRDFYVWSDSAESYQEARIIFQDFETSNWAWDPVAKAYYWHRFYSHQPDLNYHNPHVRKALFKVMDFWLKMGVDGLRLDAVPYLYEREGTNCENLPETHAFLKELRRHVDERFENRMLLAEANQWPEDAIVYFGDGDECHTAFHFPLMPRMFMSVYMEDRFPIVDILAQTPQTPTRCQWVLFLRNHDELTLEMVTDEERDYMYRVYARDPEARINLGIRRRLAPLLGNLRRRFELMNALLFSLPGTPVIYYGDEIGMGDNIFLGDRNGVRTPMQWSADRNAGFSSANSQRLFLPVVVDPEYHYETVNVQAQQNNPHSLLWWMKRLIALRKRYKAFSRGSMEILQVGNRKVLAFIRRHGDQVILVVANLSRFVQCAELGLADFRGMVPVEMFGKTEFPPIGDLPYFITLGPHAFYWFSLEPQGRLSPVYSGEAPTYTVPLLAINRTWEDLVRGRGRSILAEVLPAYLRAQRWFGGKARTVKSAQIVEATSAPYELGTAFIALVRVEYTEGAAETYVLPLAFATGERANSLLQSEPNAVVARLQLVDAGGEGVLCDALTERDFGKMLFEATVGRRRLKGAETRWQASATKEVRQIYSTGEAPPEASRMKGEQSNSSLIFGDQFVLKIFRRLESGINPDLEIGRFLANKGFAHTPRLAGALECQLGRSERMTVGILQSFVRNEGDAWRYTLDSLGRYFERSLASDTKVRKLPPTTSTLLDLADRSRSTPAPELIADYLAASQLLGRRTAHMHLALASDSRSPDFRPEPFSSLYQRSIYQSMRVLAARVLQTLGSEWRGLPRPVQEEARRVLELEGEIVSRFQALLDHKISAMRIRCHGDYHLGQVLHTGKDFVIFDFEGEPIRPLSERKIKRSPLRDVAGMLRSFHYAAHAAMFGQVPGVLVGAEDESLEPWVRYWHVWVSATFLEAYLAEAAGAPFIPKTREELQVLLNVFLLEKAVYELGYELNNRPAWARIPLKGILEMMEAGI
ncbi:MAG: maltose alpha-D-glucosyltransferase [Chloroflexi bacterium]|nr:maltose alpha-D-glucosyltransferase [Chloroflexota bacterium]